MKSMKQAVVALLLLLPLLCIPPLSAEGGELFYTGKSDYVYEGAPGGHPLFMPQKNLSDL